MKKLISLYLLTFSNFFVTAQDQVIFSDRPTFTDAVRLIAPGTFQVEAGYKSSYTGTQVTDDGVTHVLPALSLKYGLTEWLELRVNSHYTFVEYKSMIIEELKGIEQITFSPKFGLVKQKGAIPTLSFITSVTKPLLQHVNYGPQEKWFYNSRLLFEYTFKKFSWSNSFGTIWMEDVLEYSSMGRYRIAEKSSTFLEFYGLASFPYQLHSDIGFTYLLSDNFQLDIIYGRQLHNEPVSRRSKRSQIFGFGAAWNTHFR